MNSKRSKSTLLRGSSARQATMTIDSPQNSVLLRAVTSWETARIMPRTPRGFGIRRMGIHMIMAGSKVRVTI